MGSDFAFMWGRLRVSSHVARRRLQFRRYWGLRVGRIFIGVMIGEL